MNIYVGNLPYNVGDDDMRALFAPFGQVMSAQVIVDRRSHRSRGYGFVEMADDAEARRAIEKLNGTEFRGRELRISESSAKGEQPAERSHGNRRSEQAPRQRQKAAPAQQKPATAAKESSPGKGGLFGLLRKLFG